MICFRRMSLVDRALLRLSRKRREAYEAGVLAAMMRLCRNPECGGELDTGWECNSCGFDAFSLVQRQFGLPIGD